MKIKRKPVRYSITVTEEELKLLRQAVLFADGTLTATTAEAIRFRDHLMAKGVYNPSRAMQKLLRSTSYE